jgi:hypothetical protein
MDENKMLLEYEVKVRLTGVRAVKVRAQNVADAVEAVQKPISMDDGTILFCEAEHIREVEGD